MKHDTNFIVEPMGIQGLARFGANWTPGERKYRSSLTAYDSHIMQWPGIKRHIISLGLDHTGACALYT